MDVNIDYNCRWIRKRIFSALPLHCYLALGAYQVCCTCGAAGCTHTRHLYLCGPGFHFSRGDCSTKSMLRIVFVSLIFSNISPVEVSEPWSVKQSETQYKCILLYPSWLLFSSTISSKSLFWEFYLIGSNNWVYILGKVVTFQHIGSDKVRRKERLVDFSQQNCCAHAAVGSLEDETQAERLIAISVLVCSCR